MYIFHTKFASQLSTWGCVQAGRSPVALASPSALQTKPTRASLRGSQRGSDFRAQPPLNQLWPFSPLLFLWNFQTQVCLPVGKVPVILGVWIGVETHTYVLTWKEVMLTTVNVWGVNPQIKAYADFQSHTTPLRSYLKEFSSCLPA